MVPIIEIQNLHLHTSQLEYFIQFLILKLVFHFLECTINILFY